MSRKGICGQARKSKPLPAETSETFAKKLSKCVRWPDDHSGKEPSSVIHQGGCFVNLTQARVTWKEEPWLRKCLLQASLWGYFKPFPLDTLPGAEKELSTYLGQAT